MMLKNKILLITGGTGSFGNAVLQKFINTDIKEIRIFSRDEKKQHDMRVKYNNKHANSGCLWSSFWNFACIRHDVPKLPNICVFCHSSKG